MESAGNELSNLLTALIKVGNDLATAPDIDDLCRRAVEAGLQSLRLERLAIWLLDADQETIRGTFGTDERGVLRDEHALSQPWADHLPERQLMETPNQIFRREDSPLFDHNHNVVGRGESGAAALWNGEEVLGMVYMDNLLSQCPISSVQWHIFGLYASALAHLLTLKRTESALRSQDELLNQILDIMPVGIFVLSPEEKIVRYNRAARELWELDPQQIDSWSPTALWAAGGRSVEKEEWAGRRALADGQRVLHQEVEVLRTDGTRRFLLNSGVPLRDMQGALAGAVVVNQDITDAKRREQQLEALAYMGQTLRPLVGQRGTLQIIITHLAKLLSPRGVAVLLHGEDGRTTVEAANGDYAPLANVVVPEAFTKPAPDQGNFDQESGVVFFDAEESSAHCFFKSLPSEPRFMVVAPLETENATVGAVLLGFGEMPERALLAMIAKLADSCAAAIQRGHLYDQVATQAHRLDRVMEAVNFGLVLLDPQRRVVLTNQHAKVKMAQLGEFVVGEELHELGGQKLGRFLTRPTSQSHTQEIIQESSIYEVTTVPVGATAAEGGWLMVIHDVTRERAVQSGIQQHQRLAAVGQLAAGIAHDFNNIIAVITLYVQMIQRNPALQENDQNRLNVIREQAVNASRLIRQILDFSRQTVIERQQVDLVLLIQESLALWQRTLPESIHFEFDFDSNANGEELTSALVLAEASSLQQALTNLAVNARDAMPEGGDLRVVLHALCIDELDVPPVTGLKPGEWFQISVSDSGAGIPSEHLPHIFDPFYTTKEIGKGTGLGLAQVYGIVQQHGGMVAARSEAGEGTTITLFLPAFREGMAASQELDGSEGGDDGNETILLVEDNEPAREATAALLVMLGYRVIPAANGREALALFAEHAASIHLVLSDMVMPEMGGLELYKRACAIKPDVCMLMMTGYPLEEEGQLAATQGALELLRKPFSVKQLTLAVRRVLAQAGADDELDAEYSAGQDCS